MQVHCSGRDRVSINDIPFLYCKSLQRLDEFNVQAFIYIELVHWKPYEAKEGEKKREIWELERQIRKRETKQWDSKEK